MIIAVSFEIYGGMKMEALKGKAIASMVLGIIACVLAWFNWVCIAGLICGIIGLVLAVKVRKEAQALGENPTGIMTAGLVLSIVGTALGAIFLVAMACTLCAAASIVSSLSTLY